MICSCLTPAFVFELEFAGVPSFAGVLFGPMTSITECPSTSFTLRAPAMSSCEAGAPTIHRQVLLLSALLHAMLTVGDFQLRAKIESVGGLLAMPPRKAKKRLIATTLSSETFATR